MEQTKNKPVGAGAKALQKVFSIQPPNLVETMGFYSLDYFQGIQGNSAAGYIPAHFKITSQQGSAVFNRSSYKDFNRIDVSVISQRPGGTGMVTGGVLFSFTDSDGYIIELFTTDSGGQTGVRVYVPETGDEKVLCEFGNYTDNEVFTYTFVSPLRDDGSPYDYVSVYQRPGDVFDEDPGTLLYEGNEIFGLRADTLVIGARAEFPQRVANVGSWILGITGSYTG